MRRHPVLGFSRMHRGIDFAAPTGTPVYAAGDGRVSFVGRNSGYGNYVRIDHDGGYATAYAHLSRIAAGLKRNGRVKQGQVIGQVGSTGVSTGPHLHYEILVDGRQVNPLEVKAVGNTRLCRRGDEPLRRGGGRDRPPPCPARRRRGRRHRSPALTPRAGAPASPGRTSAVGRSGAALEPYDGHAMTLPVMAARCARPPPAGHAGHRRADRGAPTSASALSALATARVVSFLRNVNRFTDTAVPPSQTVFDRLGGYPPTGKR